MKSSFGMFKDKTLDGKDVGKGDVEEGDIGNGSLER